MKGILCSLLLCALLACSGKSGVHTAVERMLSDYPASTLQDIYKSFFQDRFGPGHIVADTAQAAVYLRHELESVDNLDVKLYEPTGEHCNYYRVALAAIASGKVPFDTYLSCFLRSVREVEAVDVEVWAAEWALKEKVIASMERHNDNDFRSNIAQGGFGSPINLPSDYEQTALRCAEVLKLDYCGVDLLYGDNGEPVVCEVNSNAFFDGIEKVTGVNVAKAYAEHVIKTIIKKV